MQTVKIFDKALTYEEKDYTLCHINNSPIIILTTKLPIVEHAKLENLETLVTVHKFLEGTTHYMQEDNESSVIAKYIKYLG